MSNNKQQTAVEWLYFEINRRGPKENNPPQWLIELYEQAKEMEKERMIQFACNVFNGIYGKDYSFKDAAEHLYEQTYGGNK